MAEIILHPSSHKTPPKHVMAQINCPRPRYSIDVISERVVDGALLIEACIPVTALEVLMAYLRASPTAPGAA